MVLEKTLESPLDCKEISPGISLEGMMLKLSGGTRRVGGLLGVSKITADGDYSHGIKRCLLLGRKVMTNLDCILKAETLLCQQRSV